MQERRAENRVDWNDQADMYSEFAYEGPMSGPIVEMSGALGETQMFEAFPTRAFDFGPSRRTDALVARWEERLSRRKRRVEKAAALADIDPVADEPVRTAACESVAPVSCVAPDEPGRPSEEAALPEFPAKRFDCAADMASMVDALKPPFSDGGEKSPMLYAAPFRLDYDATGTNAGRMTMVVWWDVA